MIFSLRGQPVMKGGCVLKYVLMIVLCCVVATGQASTGGHRLGNQSVSQVQSSEFFKFFALTREGEQVAPVTHDTYFVYGTSGQFSGQVFVLVEVDKDGETVKGMLAIIMRTFIDTPATTTFARDFAKSFLLFATPGTDQPGMMKLAQDIWTRAAPGVTKYVNHGGTLERESSDQAMPATDAYLAFIGKQKSAAVTLQDCEISLRNAAAPGKQPALTIAVEPRQS